MEDAAIAAYYGHSDTELKDLRQVDTPRAQPGNTCTWHARRMQLLHRLSGEDQRKLRQATIGYRIAQQPVMRCAPYRCTVTPETRSPAPAIGLMQTTKLRSAAAS